MRTAKNISLLAVGIVAAVAGALLAKHLLQPPAESSTPVLVSGTLLQPARGLPEFALLDQDETPFTHDRLRGQWSLLFFGFANCGDVCPVTLALLASTQRTLADLPPDKQPRVIFISVDAERDTPSLLKAYVRTFDASFIGVTGKQSDLDAFTRSLGIPSGIRALENGGYAVDHSAAILLIDPQGKLRALFTPPQTIQGLAADYRLLVGATS